MTDKETAELARVAMELVKRASLQGSEVGAYIRVQAWLQSLMTPPKDAPADAPVVDQPKD